MKLLWPFYIYPEPGSTAVVALRENIASVWGIVVNVHSGPGPSERDANYVEFIAWLQQQHVHVFGYISSRYGDRPIDECSADIRAWKTTWGITSIFVDEANAFASKLPFYETLRTVISGLCILNHGTVPVSGYLGCGDIICTGETTWANLKGDVFPEWCKQNRARLYHIIGGLPTDQIAHALKFSNETADYIFASNFTEPEAYERLPSYFPRLLGQLKLYPAEATPVPAPPATARMLSTCTDAQLVEEIARRLAQ